MTSSEYVIPEYEKLTHSILRNIKPEEVIYAEFATTGAMGACGTARLCALHDGELHYYLTNYDYEPVNPDIEGLYESTIAHLHSLVDLKHLQYAEGGYGNTAFKPKNIRFERDDDAGAFIYHTADKSYFIECSCKGVYAHVVSRFAQRPIKLKTILRLLDRNFDSFSDAEYSFILAYTSQAERFDNGCSWFDCSPEDYTSAIRYIRFLNYENFNFSDENITRGRRALSKYRLKYVVKKLGWNRLNEFVATYFMSNDFKKSSHKQSFFSQLDVILGEKIADKFSHVETITPYYKGLCLASDQDIFSKNFLGKLFEYPVLVHFDSATNREIIQHILKIPLRANATMIALYFYNYLFQDDQLSYSEILPATFRVIKDLPPDDYNHTHTDELFRAASEIIDNAWRALDDESTEKLYRDLIYDTYWSRVGSVWPIKHYDDFEFKNEVATQIFDVSLGFVMSLPDVCERNPELERFLTSEDGRKSFIDSVKKRVFEISAKNLSHEAYIEKIFQDFDTFTALRGLATPEDVESAKVYLGQLFSVSPPVDEFGLLAAFEQILISPKRIRTGKYILEYFVEHFDRFLELVMPEEALTMFTAACLGATEQSELAPLTKFSQKVAEVLSDPQDQKILQSALIFAEKSIKTIAFQRQGITKFLLKEAK